MIFACHWCFLCFLIFSIEDGAQSSMSETSASVQINGVTDSELSKGDIDTHVDIDQKDNSSQDGRRQESQSVGAGEVEPSRTDPPHQVDRTENKKPSQSVDTLQHNTKALDAVDGHPTQTVSDTTTQRENNSVIQTSPNRSEQDEAHVTTSTPQSTHAVERVRFDSIEHEEADFEEDRILGKFPWKRINKQRNQSDKSDTCCGLIVYVVCFLLSYLAFV